MQVPTQASLELLTACEYEEVLIEGISGAL
jgi:hypothetical protein